MSIQVRFPQSPIVGPDGNLSLEWQQWLLNPQVLTVTFAVALDPSSGGTGLTTYTIGDLIVATASTTLAKLADIAIGNALLSGGVGAAPFYGKVGLTTHVSGTLPIGSGGTNATTAAGARTSLGLGTLAVLNSPLTVPDGGTGVSSSTQTYTPTLTNVANIGASTAYPCQYFQVGSVVTVSGRVDVTPTAAVLTQLDMSLPIASNLGNSYECAGTGFCPTVASQGAAILGDAVNDKAQMEWTAVNITNQPMYFSFTYQVI